MILIIYPKWDDHRVKQQQLSILTQWDEVQTEKPVKVQVIETASIETVSQVEHLVEEETTQVEDGIEEDVLEESKFEPIMFHGQQMIGKLTIESIEVSQPILASATEAALDLGVGNVITDRSPDEEGNFVLAGHRGRSYGRLLNRLHELDEGDVIKVETHHGNFEYEVDTSFLVTPDDLSVLDEQEGVSELTLITCHPVRNPTHRLIVKATLKI